jgi:hypothetical protein
LQGKKLLTFKISIMEKLKLKALKLGVNDLLSKEEMKNISGGTGCRPMVCNNEYGDVGTCGTNPIGNACMCVVGGYFYSSGLCANE